MSQRQSTVVRVAVDIGFDEAALGIHLMAVLSRMIQHVLDQGGADTAATQLRGNDGVHEAKDLALYGVSGVGCVSVHCGFEALDLRPMRYDERKGHLGLP